MFLLFLLFIWCNTGPRWFQTYAHELRPGVRVGRTLPHRSVRGNERTAALLALDEWGPLDCRGNTPLDDKLAVMLWSEHCTKWTTSSCSEINFSPVFEWAAERVNRVSSPNGRLSSSDDKDCPQPPDIILCCRARHLFVFLRSLFICHCLAPMCRASIRPLPPPALCLSARAH